MKYYDDFELLNSRPDESHAENALLWTVEHFFLTGGDNREALNKAIDIMRVSEGIFTQHPCNDLTGNERYMSRDQLLALFSYSVATGKQVHAEVWKEIKRQQYRYNNVEVPSTFMEKFTNLQLIQPIDLMYYAYCNNSFFAKITLPIWLFLATVSFSETKNGVIKTDDELLNYVKFAPFKNRWIWKFIWNRYYKKICKKFGSYNAVFRIYFRDQEDHPNIVASKGI